MENLLCDETMFPRLTNKTLKRQELKKSAGGQGYDLLHVKSVENEFDGITKLVEASGIKESSVGGLNLKKGKGYGRGQYSQPEYQHVIGKGFGRAHVIRQRQQHAQGGGVSDHQVPRVDVSDHHVPRVDGPLSMYIENARIMRTRRRIR
ncbi:hypothetical protein L1987_11103 [Smallanthus sonchifolius]|uniref:Uncharacterized protein n=1 Tax=Smallanthus sonchifolius TaxID=185202 RepID=A0ACB9JA01_9ASTR|nr:hypothetical protein L1987_11103 [Smallanthus sonchifolius]